MSNSFWKGRFGADRKLYIPLRLTEETGGGGNNTTVLARVRGNVTMAQVQADFASGRGAISGSTPQGNDSA